MKKLFFILLSLPLFFSDCQQSNPSPSGSGGGSGSAACGSLSAPGLNYNPIIQGPGGSTDICDDSQLTTYSGLLRTASIVFTSFCVNTDDWDFWLILSLDVASGIVVGTTYSANTNTVSCMLQDYSCPNATITTYTSTNVSNGALNGNIKITNIDWSNQTIDGEFNFVLYQTVSAASTLNYNGCTFSDVPFQIINN